MAAAPKGLALILGGSAKGPPDSKPGLEEDDAEPDEASNEDACHDVWDALQAKDEESFCRALSAAIKAGS
jgi:hypothetical protein